MGQFILMTCVWTRWTWRHIGGHLNQKKKRQEHYLSVMWQTLITLTHHQTKCLLHWESGRNQSKMTAVRSNPAESEVVHSVYLSDWSTWNYCVQLSRVRCYLQMLSGYIIASAGSIFTRAKKKDQRKQGLKWVSRVVQSRKISRKETQKNPSLVQ